MSVVAMPVISRNVPAYTNDDFFGSFPASSANNAVYGGQNYWRCLTAPTGGANSGTLTQAVYLAYDLSGVPSGQRQNVTLAWYNDPSTDPYNSTILATDYFNTPANYTIDVNTAAGGSLPGSGWSTLVTVAGNAYHSRQHVIALGGANWVRINITAINGSASNNNAAINMDVHDASGGQTDNWIFFGDSITQRGFDHDDIFITAGTLPAQINTSVSTNFPLMEDGGIGGLKASDVVASNYLATWLPLTSAKYIGLCYGTNDANAGGAPLINYQSNMQSLINQVIAASKIPVLPKTITWGNTANLLANVPAINAALAALITANPSVVVGPDLYAVFNADHSLISNDGIHPTDPIAIPGALGYPTYRASWTSALVNNLYNARAAGPVLLGRRHRIGAIQ